MTGRRRWLVAAFVAGVLAPVAVPGSVGAAPPPGRIAFAGTVGGVTDIWLAEAGGTGVVRRLTVTAAPEREPAVAPGGAEVAFARDGDLWVVAVDGSGERRLTGGAEVDDHPAWSPDGTRVAFVRDGDVWSVAADGTGALQVTDHDYADAHPTWSPDGRFLAFSRHNPVTRRHHVWIATADGLSEASTEGVSGADEAAAPDWSPDGTRIAVHESRRVGVDFAGVAVHRTTIGLLAADGAERAGGPEALDHSREPTWSPDGRCLAFAAAEDPGDQGGGEQIHLACADSGTLGWEAVPLLPDAGFDVATDPDWEPPGPSPVPDDPALIDTVLLGAYRHRQATGHVVVEIGGRYRITATGRYAYNAAGGLADAECSSAAGPDPVFVRNRFPAHDPPDGDPLDVHVATQAVDWVAASPDALGCDPGHEYHLDFTALGSGVPVYQIIDPEPSDDHGIITVELRRLG